MPITQRAPEQKDSTTMDQKHLLMREVKPYGHRALLEHQFCTKPANLSAKVLSLWGKVLWTAHFEWEEEGQQKRLGTHRKHRAFHLGKGWGKTQCLLRQINHHFPSNFFPQFKASAAHQRGQARPGSLPMAQLRLMALPDGQHPQGLGDSSRNFKQQGWV